MTVTVETLLRDKSMQGCKVMAGEPGLQNEVTWIHIGEVVDMGDWLEGGEFLLSCIHGPGDDKDKQIEFLRGLNKANISALGIEVGYYFDTMPDYLMAEANKFFPPYTDTARQTLCGNNSGSPAQNLGSAGISQRKSQRGKNLFEKND